MSVHSAASRTSVASSTFAPAPMGWTLSASLIAWGVNVVFIVAVLLFMMYTTLPVPEVPARSISNLTESISSIYNIGFLRQELASLIQFRDEVVCFSVQANQLWSDSIMTAYGLQLAGITANFSVSLSSDIPPSNLLSPLASWWPTLCAVEGRFCDKLSSSFQSKMIGVISSCLQMWHVHLDVVSAALVHSPPRPSVLLGGRSSCEALSEAGISLLASALTDSTDDACTASKHSGLIFASTDGTLLGHGGDAIPFTSLDGEARAGRLPSIVPIIIRSICARMPGTDCDFPSLFKEKGRNAVRSLLERRAGLRQSLLKFTLPCLENLPGMVADKFVEMQKRFLYRQRFYDADWRNGTMGIGYLPYTTPVDCWDSYTVQVGLCASDTVATDSDDAFAFEPPMPGIPNAVSFYGQSLATISLPDATVCARQGPGCKSTVAFHVHAWPVAINESGHALFAVAFATSAKAQRPVDLVDGRVPLRGNVQLPELLLEDDGATSVVAVLIGVGLMSLFYIALRLLVLCVSSQLVPHLLGIFAHEHPSDTPAHALLGGLVREAVLVGRVSSALLALVPRELRSLVVVPSPKLPSLSVRSNLKAIAKLQLVMQHPPHQVIECVCIVIAVYIRLPSREVPTFEAKLASFAEQVGGMVHPCPPGFFTALSKLNSGPQRLGGDVVPLERHVLIPVTDAKPIAGTPCGPLNATLRIVTPIDLDDAALPPSHGSSTDIPTGGKGATPSDAHATHAIARDVIGLSTHVTGRDVTGSPVSPLDRRFSAQCIGLGPDCLSPCATRSTRPLANSKGAQGQSSVRQSTAQMILASLGMHRHDKRARPSDCPVPLTARLNMYEFVTIPRGVTVYAALAAATLHVFLSPLLESYEAHPTYPRPQSLMPDVYPSSDDVLSSVHMSCELPQGRGPDGGRGAHSHSHRHPIPHSGAPGFAPPSSNMSVGVCIGPMTRGYLRLMTSADVFPEAFASGWPLTHASLMACFADRERLGIAFDLGLSDTPFLSSPSPNNSASDDGVQLATIPLVSECAAPADGAAATPPPLPLEDPLLIRIYDSVQFCPTALPSHSDGHPVRLVAQVCTPSGPIGAGLAPSSSSVAGASTTPFKATSRTPFPLSSRDLMDRMTYRADWDVSHVSPAVSSSLRNLPTNWVSSCRQVSDAVALGLARTYTPSATHAVIAEHMRAFPFDAVAGYQLHRWRSGADELATRGPPPLRPSATDVHGDGTIGVYTSLDGLPAAPLPLPSFGMTHDAETARVSTGRLDAHVSVRSSVSVEDVIEDADGGGVMMSTRPVGVPQPPAPRRVAIMYVSSTHVV